MPESWAYSFRTWFFEFQSRWYSWQVT